MARTEFIRRAFYLASSGLIALAIAIVPMPFFTFSPGSASSVAALVEVGAPTTTINGDFGLLTVTVRQPSIAELVGSRMSGDDIRRVEEVLPPDQDRRQYFEAQQRLFDQTFQVAVTVGLQAAGEDVEFTSAPIVVDVLDDAPAAGLLQPDDLIHTILGVDVSTAQELVDVGATMRDEQEVALVIERDGERMEVTVVAGQVRGMRHAGLGVSLDTVVTGFDFPYEVQLAPGVDIGGPSAGLMMALTVYDLVAEEDLANGRRIVGTGTVDLSGDVGPIGSIEQKVKAAVSAGADVFLAPASQVDLALAVAPPSLRVIAVATFDDALRALREDDTVEA